MVFGCLLLVSGSAEAFPVDLSVGLKGGASLTGAPEVPEGATVSNNGSRNRLDPQYFGIFGVGGGAGLSLDARFFEAVGLETGFYYMADNAKGTNDISSPSGETLAVWTQRQSTRALHVPLLVKGSIPSGKVRPYLGLGFEFVSQNASTLEYSGEDADQANQTLEELDDRNDIETSNYTMFQGTIGMEIDAGPVRIVPFEIRVGYNLGWQPTFDERVDVETDGSGNTRLVYDGQYIGHAAIFTGVYYRWDLKL